MKDYIDDIEEIRNIRADYEPMDIDYIDKMGEEKTITNAQEYDVLYYIVHLQKEIERLKNQSNNYAKRIIKAIEIYENRNSIEYKKKRFMEDKTIGYYMYEELKGVDKE